MTTLAASVYLTDYHWWFARRRGWLPSPALIAFYLLLAVVAIIKENFSPPRPDDQKRETACGPEQRSTEEQKYTTATAKRETAGSFEPKNTYPPVSADELGKRVGELEEEVRALRASATHLRKAGRTIIAQRKEWKARALSAEQKAADLTAQLANRQAMRDDRFEALRRLVARELHPDHCTSSDIEKLIRAEFFKRLWPEIERLVLPGDNPLRP